MKSFFIRFRTGEDSSPKTVGVLFDLTNSMFGLQDGWSASDALTIYKIVQHVIRDKGAAAKGKVIFINRSKAVPEVICFQANGQKAQVAWCGNAYAAVSAYLHSLDLAAEFVVLNEDHKLYVSANVTSSVEGFSVTQSWILENQYVLNEPGSLQDPAIVYLRFLNDYRMVLTRGSEQFEFYYNQFAASLHALRLTEKVCLLDLESGKVVFFTSSYIHGDAPVTGLCSLALLRQKTTRLAGITFPDRILTPSGEHTLPALQIYDGQIAMGIGQINVNLQNL